MSTNVSPSQSQAIDVPAGTAINLSFNIFSYNVSCHSWLTRVLLSFIYVPTATSTHKATRVRCLKPFSWDIILLCFDRTKRQIGNRNTPPRLGGRANPTLPFLCDWLVIVSRPIVYVMLLKNLNVKLCWIFWVVVLLSSGETGSFCCMNATKK